jgi:hypothetical protein
LGLTIQVGSGADEAGGSASTSAASRTNPAYGGNTQGIMAYIGQPGVSSGMTTGTSGSTSQTTAPVPTLPPLGVVIPGSPSETGQSNSAPMNPMGAQLGAPRMLKGLGASLIPTLPGGLGVGNVPPNNLAPAGPGGY